MAEDINIEDDAIALEDIDGEAEEANVSGLVDYVYEKYKLFTFITT